VGHCSASISTICTIGKDLLRDPDSMARVTCVPARLRRYQACPVWQWGHFTVVDTGATNTKPHSQL
jgi:hypothetical protein